METHEKLRMDILIEAPLQGRLSEMLDRHKVSGYTIFPALGGRGLDGAWSRTGQITAVGQMVLFTCILDRGRGGALLDDLYARMAHHIGYVTTSDVSVIRQEKFP